MPEIAGVFDTDFWAAILQFSETEPVLQHALSTLSTVYEHYRRDRMIRQRSDHSTTDSKDMRPTRPTATPLTPFAIDQYNKAIKLLLTYEQLGDARSLNIMLMVCLVFVCLEYLRNDFKMGLKHLKSGLNILNYRGHNLNDPNPVPNAVARGSLDQALLEFYTRLDIQATVHENAISDFNLTISGYCKPMLRFPLSFSCIGDAQTTLGEELCAIFLFIRHRYDGCYDGRTSHDNSPTLSDGASGSSPLSTTPEISNGRQRDHHLENLKHWRTAFSPFVGTTVAPANHDDHHRHIIPLLLIYHDLAVLQLSALTFKSQMEYDAFRPNFESMVANAWQVLQGLDAIGPRPPKISFDLGLLAPLFFIALKCRHLQTRRRAIALMRLAQEREGLWLRDNIIEYSEWKLEHEEAGRGDLDEDAVLPEESRIFGETVSQVIVDGQPVRVLCFYRGPPGILGVLKYEEVVTDVALSMGDFI